MKLIKSILEKLVLTDYNWRTCCNDEFLKSDVMEQLGKVREQCTREFPTNKNCAVFCAFTKFKLYDTILGFHSNDILEVVGSKGLVTNGQGDWKYPLGDQYAHECLYWVENAPNDDTLICNPDILVFGNCYWNNLISKCPAHLKNATNC